MKQRINVVWFKRDLRSQDHAALSQAEVSDLPFISLFIFEPTMLSYPDTSDRHLIFQYHSIIDVNIRVFDAIQKSINICYGEVKDVFASLADQFEVANVFSYQESGIRPTYDRDIFMAQWFKSQGIGWQEFQRDGIVRGIKNRKDWDRKWYACMSMVPIKNTYSYQDKLDWRHNFHLPQKILDQWSQYSEAFQFPGEEHAWKYLRSFMEDRHRGYTRNISKPGQSRMHCSRLSPYLAWGNLSVRQVYHIAKQNNKEISSRDVHNFVTRLKWRCHFIQKFEMDVSYEYTHINSAYDSFVYKEDESKLQAWKEGKTGYPLVDACMRCLIKTGWINFRMRALLVSFLCHNLKMDWRKGSHHLAGLFLDYEPGIHYPQFQMQAGTTGVNTIRIYNVVKNAKDHDADAQFVSKYCPELAELPLHLKFEPWTITAMESAMYSFQLGRDYPYPVSDASSLAEHRSTLWAYRKSSNVKEEGKKILEKHVRPK